MPFTPLETAVMQALAWDLRDLAPDLAGQFEESLPGARRNTGHGLTTEMIVSPRRPAPVETPTGSFGTVHAMVGDLPGSTAFKVQLRGGVLLGLEGEAFDMDTTDIDFATTSFHTVFTVDDQGKSIAFDPKVLLGRSPLRDLQAWADPTPAPASADPPLVNVGALQRVQDTARTLDNTPHETPVAKLADAQTSLFIGLCVLVAILALLAWWLLRLPFPLVAVVAFWICRALRNPRALNAAARLFTRLQIVFEAWLRTAQKR